MNSDPKQRILERLTLKSSGFARSSVAASNRVEIGDPIQFADNAAVNECRVLQASSLDSALATLAELALQEKWPTPIGVAPSLQPHWPQTTVSADFGSNHGEKYACISQAYAGLEDTGSLVLLSSPQSPTLLNFLSTFHVVLLARKRILKNKSALWPLLRQEIPHMPRSINIITGPSRTADIEQTIQLGAHGPKYLTVVLYDDHS